MSRTTLFSCVCAALLVAVVCLLAPLPSVEARSNGLLTTAGCDLSPQMRWPNGKFGRNKTGAGNAGVTVPGGQDSNIMRWTDAPVPSSFYTIRSGDFPQRSSDPTMYTPGVYSEIHIRVFDLKRRFIGLVLYATNVTNPVLGAFKETQVGSWVIPSGAAFQVPSETCGNSVVTHTDANLKPLHTRFFFKAPKGTGTVKFRVLIKQGEQNKGSFFWPVQELTLTEGPAPVVPTIPAGVNATILPLVGNGESATVIGSVGRACADVCAIQTPIMPYCHKQAILDIKSVAALNTAVTGKAAFCRLPMLAGCQFAGAPTIQSNGYCSFRSDNIAATCPASIAALNMSDPATYEPDVCYTAPLAESQAICVCTNNVAYKGANPYEGQAAGGGSGSGLNSAASSVGANGAFVALFAAFAALVSTTGSKSTRSLFVIVACVALVVALASPVAAHNYIKSVHRAYEAAVSVPCQERVGNQPHVQVVANQFFETEWSMGHGDGTVGPFYFVTVPLSEYNQLRADNITAIIKDYIKLAPLSAYKNVSSNAAMWEKHHIRLTTELTGKDANGVVQDGNYANYFKEPMGLDASDPTFIVRDVAYMDKAHPSQYSRANNAANKIIQTRFLDELVAKDKRVSYDSAKYPWIESVDAFENPFKEHYVYANQATMARFAIPARHGPGDYVVWFYWSGYKDCIDVNVQSGTAPIALRYGYNTTGQLSTVIKQDHCEYTYIPNARTMARRMNNVTRDASQCIADCRKTGCTGVQVVRAINPASALPALVNLPYVPYVNNQTAVDLKQPNPCGAFTAAERQTNGCNSTPSNNLKPGMWQPALTEADYICFGVSPLRNQDNQVEEDYTIASDPLDPVFYSTCYQFAPVGGFLNIPAWTYEPPTWAVGDQCIDCNYHNNLRKLNVSQVPDWTTPGAIRKQDAASGCIDCDLVNSKLNVRQAQALLSGADQPNAGIQSS